MNTVYTLDKAPTCPKHEHPLHMKSCTPQPLFRLLGAAGTCLMLVGCDGVSGATNDATNTEKPKTFTFKGQLPENFGIKTIVFYYPLKPELTECQRQVMGVGPGVFEPRLKVVSYAAEISNESQSFSFAIPLERSVDACDMKLARIDLNIRAKFGEESWQKTYADGGFRIVNVLPEGAKTFNKNNVLELHGKCSWTFKESLARSTPGEITKLLGCSGAGAYLPIEQLPGKMVTLDITTNPEERPYYRGTWIKFEKGWKPCQGNEKSDQCSTPPIFKTFKMNGKTCTTYPTCTE